MSILSFDESSPDALVADRICGVIDSHADALRRVELGRRFKIDGVAFRLYRADRNVIYTVHEGGRWFLKMPRDVDSHVIAREISGAERARDALRDCAGYLPPRACRASAEKKYLLTFEIRGALINRALYRSMFTPLPGVTKDTLEAFSHLGQAMARLHSAGPPPEHNATKPTLDEQLRRALEDAAGADPLRDEVERWADSLDTEFDRNEFSHANFRHENILISGRRVTFIDFENSGRGSIYDDLSWPCAHCLLTTTARHLPARRSLASQDSFLRGYQDCGNYDPQRLTQATTLRVARFYVRHFCGNQPWPRIAWLPVSRVAVERLLRSLITGDRTIESHAVATS